MLGGILPLAGGFFSIPILIRNIGNERFGILSIAWMVIGYFSLFDFGLGRALTQMVSSALGKGDHDAIPKIVRTSMTLMGAFGMVGALILMALSYQLVHGILKVTPDLQTEAFYTILILAATIPFVVLTTGFRGILEAYQKFGQANAVRAPLGLFTFLGPLLVLPFSKSLPPVVAVLAVGRIISWYIYVVLCSKIVAIKWYKFTVDVDIVRKLLTFGVWMTVSNVVGPIMVYFDRFVIGAIVSMAAVAFYVTPYEVITKATMISVAVVGVLFPAFATSFTGDPERTTQLFENALYSLTIILFPPILLAVAFAKEGMAIWINEDFARNSYIVLQWLAIGVFINSLTRVPFTLVQGYGRPDISAKVHLIELPIAVTSLYYAVKWYSLQGAAIVWAGRMALDAIAFFFLAAKLFPSLRKVIGRNMLYIVVVVLVLCSVMRIPSLKAKVPFIIVALMFFTFVVLRSPVYQTAYKLFMKEISKRGTRSERKAYLR